MTATISDCGLYRYTLYALGFTNSGMPKHPLARGRHRVADDAELVRVIQ